MVPVGPDWTDGVRSRVDGPMTAKQSRAEMIAYLVGRRFPSLRAIRASSSISGRSTIIVGDRQSVLDHAAAFEAELAALPDDKIAARVRMAQEDEARVIRERFEAEENARFFNQPYAKADNQYWSKAAYWSIDEALALSFGRDPSRVNWKSVEPHVPVSSFAAEYARQRTLLLRAVAMKQLSDGTLPGAFLAWAKRNRFPYPQELEDAVRQHGHQIADWKSMYDDLAERLAKMERSRDEHSAQADEALKLADGWQAMLKEQDKRIGDLVAAHAVQVAKVTQSARQVGAQLDAVTIERDALKTERSLLIAERESLTALVTEVQGKLDATTAPEKPLHPSIRRSFNRMILGMAKDKFNFKPGAQKSPATKNIADALARQGLKLDEDTVRTRLQEAAQEDVFEPNTAEKSA